MSDGTGKGSEFVVRLPAARTIDSAVTSLVGNSRPAAQARAGLKKAETRP